MIPFINSMKEAFDLTGKNAIVTGGNGGIGLGIAKALAECGANVAILCRNMEKAENALNQLKSFDVKSQAFSCDILDPESIRIAVDGVCSAFGEINILVNNSGIGGVGDLLDMEQGLPTYHEVINTDLLGMVHMTYEVGKRMRGAGKGGAIVNITSNAGFIVNKGVTMTPYSVAKAGANQFTRCAAAELGAYDIRVNGIAPGYTRAGFGENPSQELIDLVNFQQPLKRMGEAIEIGATAVFLASPASAHITGEVIIVDGGYTLQA